MAKMSDVIKAYENGEDWERFFTPEQLSNFRETSSKLSKHFQMLLETDYKPGALLGDLIILIFKSYTEDQKLEALDRLTRKGGYFSQPVQANQWEENKRAFVKAIEREAHFTNKSFDETKLEHLRASLLSELNSILHIHPIDPILVRKELGKAIGKSFTKFLINQRKARIEIELPSDFDQESEARSEDRDKIDLQLLTRKLSKDELAILNATAQDITMVDFAQQNGITPAAARQRLKRAKNKARKLAEK